MGREVYPVSAMGVPTEFERSRKSGYILDQYTSITMGREVYPLISTDLADRGFGKGGVNFLKTTELLAKNIITNPPYGNYGLGDAFFRRALIHTQKLEEK